MIRKNPLSEKAFLQSQLCRFGLQHFLQLGRECRHVLEGETIISRYLGPIDGRLNATVPKAKYEDWKGLGI